MFEVLKEELLLLYPTLLVENTNNGVEISDFAIAGLRVTIDTRLVIRLDKVSDLSKDSLVTYLSIHMENSANRIVNDTGIYYYYKGYNNHLYANHKINLFEKRMWLIRMLKQLELLINNLNLGIVE